MKRRTFLRNTAIVVSAASSMNMLMPVAAKGMNFKKSTRFPGSNGVKKIDNRTVDYLRRAQGEKYLPKAPVFVQTKQTPEVQVLPMPMEERLKRKIIPQHGFCSIIPGKTTSAGITSGNGAMNIELMGDPYSEQILFHHESLLMPWKRPLEAPKVAEIFPKVRQMIMEGKYQEAIEFAFKEMEKGPIKPNTWPHPTIPAFLMALDFPKTSSIKNYLRTVNFENSEVNVHWDDENGNWIRKAFTSRPDNVVVQLLTAPKGQEVNARITLSDSSRRRPNAFQQQTSPATSSGESEIKHDYNVQRLIYKCRLDPSTNNSGYAGVIRVVRNGGSSRMDNNTLVIENASSVMLLTCIEWFDDYSEEKVEALQLKVEELTPDYQAMVDRHYKVQSEMFNRVTVDFGGASQYGMSTEELFADEIPAGLLSCIVGKDIRNGAVLVYPNQW